MLPGRFYFQDKRAATALRLACVVGLAALVFVALIRSLPTLSSIAVKSSALPDWIVAKRPYPAFDLNIPEAVDMVSNSRVSRQVADDGRKDIMTLGDMNGPSPHLMVEVLQPGRTAGHFGTAMDEIASRATDLGPIVAMRNDQDLKSKFGPLQVVSFATVGDVPRQCLGFVRAFEDPRLLISGWFCQAEAKPVERSMLSCALDRLTLLNSRSDPKISALFANAELNRSFCDRRIPLFAATTEYPPSSWPDLKTGPDGPSQD